MLEAVMPIGMVVIVVMTVMVMIMMVMSIVVMVMMRMRVIVAVGFQEFRLDIENAIEVEGIAPEHLGQRHCAALRLVDLRVRIDAANARLDVAQIGAADEVGLVDENDVGKGNLIL